MSVTWWLKPGPHETPSMRPSWWNRRQMDLRQPGWFYCRCGMVRSKSDGSAPWAYPYGYVQINGTVHRETGCSSSTSLTSAVVMRAS